MKTPKVKTIYLKYKTEDIGELSYSLDEIPNTVYIKSVFVEKDHRKKGFAKNMVLDLLKKHQEKDVILNCTKTSKKVWEKMGFVFKKMTSTMKATEILTFNNY